MRNLRTERSPEGTELLFARCSILQAARSAGIQAFDTVYSDANNEAGFLHEAAHIKQLGFDGKAVISPHHVHRVNQAFMPAPDKVNWARRVMATARKASEEGKGAVSLDGMMIDLPIIKRAERILLLADA